MYAVGGYYYLLYYFCSKTVTKIYSAVTIHIFKEKSRGAIPNITRFSNTSSLLITKFGVLKPV